MPFNSVVAAVFDFSAVLPAEDDALVVDDDEAAADEPGVAEFAFGDLAFALEGSEAGAPGHGAGGDVIIAGHLDSFDMVAALFNTDYFVEMAGVKPDPLAS